jgi:3-oxoacyl-[acyl-carrier protein] reductase
MAFAREGAVVTLFGRRREALEAVRRDIAAISDLPTQAVTGAIGVQTDLDSVAEAGAATTGSIDALFVNGGGPRPGTFADIDDEAWQAAFTTTLLGYVRAIRSCLPYMLDTGGWIMNNTSSGVKAALDGLILSNVFRMGVVGLTKTLAVELGPSNILVNAIAAGRIATDRVATLDEMRAKRADVAPLDIRRQTEASIPLRRYGTSDEFARTVVFHCSPANTYVTGQTLLVDGGMVRGT